MRKIIVSAVFTAMLVFGLASCGSGVTSMSYSDYDLDEYIDAGQYKGLTVTPYAISVSDDEMKTEMDKVLQEAAKSHDLKTGDEIKKGDTVNIDFDGTVNGKTFEGGASDGFDLTIGSGALIDGFEDGLIGKKVGDTTKLDLTFPKDYSKKNLAGKDVVFTVKINSAKRSDVPSKEEYVKGNDDYDSVEAFEKAIKKKLRNQKEETAIKEQKQALWSEALDKTKVKKYPDREVNAYTELNSKQIDAYAEQYGIDREQMLKQYGFNSEEDFAAVNQDSSKLRVKQEMLLEYIAAKEGLTYTDEEAETMLQDMKSSGYDEEAIEKQTGRTAEDYIHIELLYEKTLDFILENAKIKGAAKEY